MSVTEQTFSSEEQLQSAIQRLIAKTMTGSATPSDKALLQDLLDQKSRGMRSPAFERIEKIRRDHYR
jgi:hypothetical protein